MTGGSNVLVEGLMFPEGPRWRDDRLWLVDMQAHRVLTVDMGGRTLTVADVDDKPSGLGFLPDGPLVAPLMRTRRLVGIAGGRVSLHAELSRVPGESINDMAMDVAGRAYVGNRQDYWHPGFQRSESDPGPDEIILVTAQGKVRVAADRLWR